MGHADNNPTTNGYYDPLKPIIARIVQGVMDSLKDLYHHDTIHYAKTFEDLRIHIDTVPEGYEGDIAIPMFPLASIVRKDPSGIACEIAERFNCLYGYEGYKAVAIGPYLNVVMPFYMVRHNLFKVVNPKFKGFRSMPRKGIRVVVEHTSANPTGPLHVGRARNPIIGDTIARMLKFCGYDVKVEYYVNDMGKQAATLYWGTKHLHCYNGREEKDAYTLVKCYQMASKMAQEDKKVEMEISTIMKAYEMGDEGLKKEIRDVCTRVLKDNELTLRRLGVEYDCYVWESEYVFNGMVRRIIDDLKSKGKLHDDGGAKYIDLEEYDLPAREKKAYICRSDGTTLYLTRDLAYHIDKLSRADWVIDILGEDHKMQSKILRIILELLGVKRDYDVIFHSFISLPEGKMSTREGRVVYIDDLIAEGIKRAKLEVEKRRNDLTPREINAIAEVVGTNAVRFNIIRIYHEKNILFRWDEALDFEGDSAPFIMYTYARANGILKNSSMHIDEYWNIDYIDLLNHASEKALIMAMARVPSEIEKALDEMKPNSVAQLAVEIGAKFNQFYRDCPVITAENEMLKCARLMLVHAYKLLIKDIMWVLGLKAIEEM